MLLNNIQKIKFVSSFVGELFGFVCDLVEKIMNFEKFEYRSMIKFLTKEGVAPKDIQQRLVAVYRDLAPSKATVARWAAEFKRGRRSIEGDPHWPTGGGDDSRTLCCCGTAGDG